MSALGFSSQFLPLPWYLLSFAFIVYLAVQRLTPYPDNPLPHVPDLLLLLITEQRKFSSVAQSCLTLLQPHGLQHARLPCPSPTPGACSTHVHRVGDAIQPSHPLSAPSPPAFCLSQHRSLFKWVSFLHQVAKVFVGVSASASVLPVNIQNWFPLGWTGWISLQPKGLSLAGV